MTSEQLRWTLLVLLGLPLTGGVVVAALGSTRPALVRWLALGFTLAELVIIALLIGGVEPSLAARPIDKPNTNLSTFFPECVPGATDSNPHLTTWDVVPVGMPTHGSAPAVQFFVGLDGLNIWLVGLTCLLAFVAVLASWDATADRPHAYFAWLLVLQTGALGVFLSFDIVLFYTFFELTLVPLYFLIGQWGGPNRRDAANRYFLYTLAGSLITLVGIVGVVWAAYLRSNELTFSLPRLVELMQQPIVPANNTLENRAFLDGLHTALFLTLAAGFIVKVPLVPLHTWLPVAYTEAPTAVTVLLSGVLAKMGTYGLLRFVLPLLPDASLSIGLPLLGGLGLLGLIYGALCAYAQTDLKKLVAYGSVAHLGFLVLGLFAMNQAGLAGGLLHMVNHGVYTAGLFLVVGMISDRYGTRQITDFGGLAGRLPWLSVLMVGLCLAAVGLPGLNGFVGELLMLAGTFGIVSPTASGPWLAAGAVAGLVLGAWYTFTMLRRVYFGPLKEPVTAGSVRDLSVRELTVLLPLVALCVWLGVRPQPVLDAAAFDVAVVNHIADGARARDGLPNLTPQPRVIPPPPPGVMR